jgi:hypothetical protein
MTVPVGVEVDPILTEKAVPARVMVMTTMAFLVVWES